MKKEVIITPQKITWINRGRMTTKIRQVNNVIFYKETNSISHTNKYEVTAAVNLLGLVNKWYGDKTRYNYGPKGIYKIDQTLER